MIYADNAATTRLSPRARKAMLPFLDGIYANPSSLHSLGQAAKEALKKREENAAYVRALRDRLAEGLSLIPYSVVNGDMQQRLPGNLNLCFEGIEGESLLLLLDLAEADIPHKNKRHWPKKPMSFFFKPLLVRAGSR